MNELESDYRIDPEALDVECVRQVDLFVKWSERAQRAREAVETAKLDMDASLADLDGRARRKPAQFGLEKVTDAAVKSAITSHPEYLRKQRAHSRARSDLSHLEIAKEAMELKRRMLEGLITLHGQQYFAGPSTPRDLPREWKVFTTRKERSVNLRIKGKLRKREE